jgi:hypothetical protein
MEKRKNPLIPDPAPRFLCSRPPGGVSDSADKRRGREFFALRLWQPLDVEPGAESVATVRGRVAA